MSIDRGLIDRFLEMMAAESGAAKNTIAAYRSDLALASGFLAGGLSAATPEDLTRLAGQWIDLSHASVARNRSPPESAPTGRWM